VLQLAWVIALSPNPAMAGFMAPKNRPYKVNVVGSLAQEQE
jgi:hypothetical protein